MSPLRGLTPTAHPFYNDAAPDGAVLKNMSVVGRRRSARAGLGREEAIRTCSSLTPARAERRALPSTVSGWTRGRCRKRFRATRTKGAKGAKGEEILDFGLRRWDLGLPNGPPRPVRNPRSPIQNPKPSISCLVTPRPCRSGAGGPGPTGCAGRGRGFDRRAAVPRRGWD